MQPAGRLLIFLVCHVLWTDTQVSADCGKTGPCMCKGAQGKIDLSPIAKTGSPAFHDIKDPSGSWLFSYNPCTSFDEQQCTTVAACQIQSDMSFAYPIGSQDSATFKTDSTSGNPLIEYSSIGNDGVTRTSRVTLVCDDSGGGDKLDVKGEDPPGSAIYLMTLTSKYCCFSADPGPGPGPGGEGSGLSLGSILCIAFFGLVVLYFVAGLAIQRFVRKAQGRETVPNYTFWSKMPGLIKDGVKFTVTCGKSSASYEKM